mmetsp:Transcript_16525/g.28076  ORF Transcript_16525/g.28076 Transcript_16525/m.28076 type:complete len:131 (-) Transcript_16525:141-533(-)
MFVHKDIVKALVEHFNQYPSVSYQAINKEGTKHQNVDDNEINAVTWGVFKGREIIQPTVVDHQAFEIWKNEVFRAWHDTWGAIYKGEDGDEASLKFLDQCSNDLFLVNIVDNDFIEGDLSKILLDFVDKN